MSSILCPEWQLLPPRAGGFEKTSFNGQRKRERPFQLKFFETFFLDNGGELRFANVVKSFGNGSSNFWTLFEVKNVCVAAKIIANPSDQVLWISGHLSVETLVDLSKTLQRILEAMFRDMAFCHYLYYGNSWWPWHKTHKISLNHYKSAVITLCKNSEKDSTNPGIMLAESSLNAAFWSVFHQCTGSLYIWH